MTVMSAGLDHALNTVQILMNAQLDQLIPNAVGPERQVMDAMRYSTLDGGKRLRPFLAIQSASLFDVPEISALRTAAALEMIHCYSLIHDDLPCMDNDDLRRGRPTCHRQFNEETALLAGDALLTLAFEVLADEQTHGDANIRCRLVKELAHAAGAQGMVGGQMIDLMAQGLTLDLAGITQLQQMKTGRLIAYGVEVGGWLANAAPDLQLCLKNYAHDLGLAFQIADDLLDVEGSVEEMGKQVGKDNDAGKATFVSLLGLNEAKAQANALADRAISALAPFGEKADLLRQTARYVVERRA